MYDHANRLVAAVQAGTMSRREAVRCLVALAAATFAADTLAEDATGRAGPVHPARGLNHLALRVSDVKRSRDFYRTHLGLRVLRESSSTCFLAAGANQFVALFRGDTPGLDHYCYTVDGYDADSVVGSLTAAGLVPARREDRVYADDPDGITFQLAGEWNEREGGRPG